MPEVTVGLIIRPAAESTLTGVQRVLLAGKIGELNVAGYTVTLNGAELEAPVRFGANFKLLVDTRLHFNGEQKLKVVAQISEEEELEEEIDVTVNNSFANNVSFQVIGVENTRSDQYIVSADVGIKSFPLPDISRFHTWMQSRLLTEKTPLGGGGGLVDIPSLDETDLEGLGEAWSVGQPVVLQDGSRSAGGGHSPAFLWHWAPDQRLAYPGDNVWWMLRQEPQELATWWETGYDLVSKPRRDVDASIDGNEVWHFLATKADHSGAAIFKFKISGTLHDPVVTLDKWQDLDEKAPDTTDYALVADKLYLLRASSNTIRVLDLDTLDVTLDIGIPDEPRAPKFLEARGEIPVVICVDEEREGTTLDPKSVAYNLVFNSPRKAWSLEEAVTAVRYVPSNPDVFLVAAGAQLYLASGEEALGASGPEGDPFPADITSLGATDAILVGLSNGQVWSFTNPTWMLQTTRPDDVTAVGGWRSQGEGFHLVAGTASAQLAEASEDGSWGAGTELTPAGELDLVTFLEGIERVISPASGEVGQPDYQPAILEYRLLIGTGNSGLVGTLQRSTLSAAQGAFPAYEHNEPYLVPTLGPKTQIESEDA